MTSSPPSDSQELGRVRRRLVPRVRDLRLIEEASREIADLGADLDARLQNETRPAERLRMLRETTNRITRTANDAVQAYGRVSRALDAERARPDGNAAEADGMRAQLDAARAEILRALELAGRRYPAAQEDLAGDDA